MTVIKLPVVKLSRRELLKALIKGSASIVINLEQPTTETEDKV